LLLLPCPAAPPRAASSFSIFQWSDQFTNLFSFYVETR
jgi:hypothetical protein